MRHNCGNSSVYPGICTFFVHNATHRWGVRGRVGGVGLVACWGSQKPSSVDDTTGKLPDGKLFDDPIFKPPEMRKLK